MVTFVRRAAFSIFLSAAVAHGIELPRGLKLEGQQEVRTLTLGQAVEMALASNLEIQFNKVDVKVEEARRRFAAGIFDPVFNASASRESLDRPDITSNLTQAESLLQLAQIRAIEENTRQLQIINNQPVTRFSDFSNNRTFIFQQDADRAEAGLQFRTPLGTRAALTAREAKVRTTFEGDQRTIRPFYQAFGGIEVRQPLLKDFGPAANLADVRAARITQQVAELSWEKSVSDALSAVLGNYFDMLFAQSDLRVKQDAIAADSKLVEQNMRRLELGFMSPIDVQQARAQVSLDTEQQLLSKNLFMERQFALRRLISREAQDNSSRIFLPVETPNLNMPTSDRATLLGVAFTKRPDYLAAVTDAGKQDIRLRFARNQLWPQLDVLGTYGYNGLGNSEIEARRGAIDKQAPQWSFGLQFSMPLGNVQGRAQLAAIKGFKEQAILKIRQSELTVTVDVDTALSRIETSKQRLATARQTRELNEEAVRIAYKRLEEGQISSFDLIEQQRRVYDAHSRELGARADLNKSIATLWQATGTVLENMGIEIVRGDRRRTELDAVRIVSKPAAPVPIKVSRRPASKARPAAAPQAVSGPGVHVAEPVSAASLAGASKSGAQRAR